MRPTSRSRHRYAAATALAAAVALLATACSAQSQETTLSNGVKLVKKGRLTTCTHLPYAPFQSTQNGKVVGFDVSLIDLVAKKLGVKQQIIDTSFETIKTGAALDAGSCDIAAAGMTITPERKRHLDFSVPYFDATQALMARKGVPATDLAAVESRKLKLGSQSSTTGEDYANAHGGDPVSYESSDAELNGLRTGAVDVIIQDYPVVQNWLKDPANSSKFALAGDIDTGEQYGFAVKKGGNPKLLATVDEVIKQAIADGAYKKLYEQWIGPMPKSAGNIG
ncbi:ABC transporter substrate-binding protein [Phaeacidiphilus oryzae]|uniref:ABC transporter substrate-binding protein n=1 Tax=Phaeacidiphilus oryzae TaxID=348818 RepID=UPI0005668BB8|nr:ABC transporter substrate-binding protein [Phaeacidiphilus oryzae]